MEDFYFSSTRNCYEFRCKKCKGKYSQENYKIKGHKKQSKEERKLIEKRRYDKYIKDPNFRIRRNLRRRINHALNGRLKSDGTMNLLGCSQNDFRTHLESLFKPGMSFQNYGEWHIDHIRPCISFNLLEETEQRKCFHYTNLQPLWAKDNLSKAGQDRRLKIE